VQFWRVTFIILVIAFMQDIYSCVPETNPFYTFDVLLTVHLSIFISVINQLDAQIALHSLWYHHIYRCDDTRG